VPVELTELDQTPILVGVFEVGVRDQLLAAPRRDRQGQRKDKP
jgi:hypothetical protein